MIRDLSSVTRDDITSAARLLRGLPSLLRHPLRVDEAKTILRQRLERRGANFVTLMRRAVYENPSSPYRALLAAAGCEPGDLQRMVESDGVEGTLQGLYRAGVYLTVEEFKGRQPTVRGSTTITIAPEDLHNPLDPSYLAIRSGGTRGSATTVPIGLESVREMAVNQCLSIYARDGLAWPQAIWGVPGGAAMRVVLRHAAFGAPPARWYSEVDPAAPSIHPRYRWSARMMRWAGLLAGMSLPLPQHVPAEEPGPILRWVTRVRAQGKIPHLRIFASAGVRVCEAANRAGVELAGTEFTLMGEPTTAARLAALERVGARGVSTYATMEAGGPIAYGCLSPQTPDDHHLYGDAYAVVQPGAAEIFGGLPARALMLTTLLSTTPIILLNVSAGDQAEMVDRQCGCGLERLGWTTHLHTIRSFEKLTAGGMTFLDTDVVRVLEEVLPGRFGGVPTDYQLVESEDADGRPSLHLLVHPALGALDEADIARTFLEAIGQGSGAERVMGLNWQHAHLLTVERRPPYVSSTGKVLHLYVEPADASSFPRPGAPSN
jgi:hypothetical protein